MGNCNLLRTTYKRSEEGRPQNENLCQRNLFWGRCKPQTPRPHNLSGPTEVVIVAQAFAPRAIPARLLE